MKFFRIIFSAFFFLLHYTSYSATKDSLVAKKHVIYGGMRIQKTYGLYYCNGVYAEFSSSKILNHRINVGLSFVTNRLGSAFYSNAIPYSELTANFNLMLRKHKKFKIVFKLNAGWAHANYGDPIFDYLQQDALLLSLEPNLSYDFKIPLRIGTGFGYNFITGDGTKGLGLVYPLFYQLNIAYRFDFK